MNEISQNKIKIYDFPDCDEEEESKTQKQLKGRIPFAAVGSNYIVEVNGERKRGRKYPWGLVESESALLLCCLQLMQYYCGLQLKILNTATSLRCEIC